MALDSKRQQKRSYKKAGNNKKSNEEQCARTIPKCPKTGKLRVETCEYRITHSHKCLNKTSARAAKNLLEWLDDHHLHTT